MITVDFGKNSATVYDGESVSTVKPVEVLRLHEKYPNRTIVGEYSHMGVPRNKKSMSQPFTESQLRKMYSDFKGAGVTLRLFPQQSTPRACLYSGLEKSDENDPVSIYRFLEKFPGTSLMHPPTDFAESRVRLEGHEWKEETNQILNFARRFDYKNEITDWMESKIDKIRSKMTEMSRCALELDDESLLYKSGRKGQYEKGDVNPNNIKRTQLFSMAAILCGTLQREEDGSVKVVKKLRLRGDKLPSWSFVKKYVICMSPFHFKGGVARSNLYYHGMKNWIISQSKKEGVLLKGKNRGLFTKEEDETYLKYRRLYCKAMKEFYFAIKETLEEEGAIGDYGKKAC